ncbi:hypothetical protein ACFO1V_06360 [Daeguia caeni]|uniref:Uncharacterized protein n=1 Tax=Daeguia caeni TaxID=439612 RepID=A0ABV9H3Q7_9HYPH
MLRTRPRGSNLWTGDRQEARHAVQVAKSLDRKSMKELYATNMTNTRWAMRYLSGQIHFVNVVDCELGQPQIISAAQSARDEFAHDKGIFHTAFINVIKFTAASVALCGAVCLMG